MNRSAQVVSIGNAFELVYQDVKPYRELSELARVDERHFGQKSTFWLTRHGKTQVVVCTAAPSPTILDANYSEGSVPTFVTPRRASSSICADLLADSLAVENLLSSLDRRIPVYLAPYVHTEHVEQVASLLLAKGYNLLDYRRQSELVQRTWNKVHAEQIIFQSVDLLRRHRPKSMAASSRRELLETIKWFGSQNVRQIVVKSGAAVGGSGVFFLKTERIHTVENLGFLSGFGQNEADRSAPFIVEERVPSTASPTVDIEVTDGGEVEIVGIALQRLFDDRYYTGFYFSPTFEQRWWFGKVEALARVVGKKLGELGYIGPANVDFVICDNTKRVFLIEVNPRRSALIDGFSILKSRLGDQTASVSVADYVNLSERFYSLEDALNALSSVCQDISTRVLPVCDGGLDSRFRWTGILAFGSNQLNSEEVLDKVANQLQDHDRNEIGLAESSVRMFKRVSKVA